ncbi:50S ribosomal protein L11 methyltransferase [Desulfovibrio legallii]|jgi:ribosomal protein L11 methyltransferase|uniref:Ribosomal protein L11 methyltransferase n=1 Tax=Desulfovibrio legallii TaxID=571438 RepID=A0A1G7JML2_9BACT|nr:50S ribosomal protein L11 methyltransferase [Desulfovibrio legallii]SDF26095.1 [LSU ribosomal protein L11P]-lysine N-methyltransferase [Desulfovibrio legallii]
MKQIFRLELTVPEVDFHRATGFLTLRVPFGWEEQSRPTGETVFRVHCENPDFIQSLRQDSLAWLPGAVCTVENLEAQDWLAAWRQFFTPVVCGRFVVLPPWLADDPAFADKTPIIIEPKSAFGTGHHATTALCLEVLSGLLDAGRVHAGQRFLDLGTGSGVLGIACCKSGLHGLGLDIDPLAVENAEENRRRNAVPQLELGLGGVEAAVGTGYDVILANILARPLTEMAPDLVRCLAPGGCLVLSGLLDIQAEGVIAAYAAQGLPVPRQAAQESWRALVWE